MRVSKVVVLVLCGVAVCLSGIAMCGYAGTRKERRHDWPGARWLRQGVRANGWVLLQRVPLWYEIWRQVNGFPPALSEGMIAETAGEKK